MVQLSPYLFFGGNCSEAMKFYQGILGGKLDIMIVGESQAAANMPPEAQKSVMHSTLSGPKMTLMASDMMDENKLVTGNRVTLALTCSQEEISSLFDKMAVGGRVSQPLKEEFFGTFGALTDKFGINWMFQADSKK